MYWQTAKMMFNIMYGVLYKKEVSVMKDYLVQFLLDGRKTEETVRAQNNIDAKRNIMARYDGHRVNILTVTPV